MPVIQILRNRLEKLIPNHSYEEITEILPYIGVDIEELTQDYVKIEYSPNRPDFSTEYGIAKALKGLFSDELGIKYWTPENSNIEVYVEESVLNVRPFIFIFAAKGLQLDDESIRQLISMQEDLHAGLGRGRKKLAIGIHDMNVLKFPLFYKAVSEDYRFIPLNMDKEVTVKEMLFITEQGQKYGHLVKDKFPVIVDKSGITLSMPPIINGNYTKITNNTKDIFVDITGNDYRSIKLAASVIAETLHDMGGKVLKGTAVYPDGKILQSPDVSSYKLSVTLDIIRNMLGLELKPEEIILSLKKSRLDASYEKGNILAIVPHYRGDIMHPVDIAEEVLLGYGLFNVKPDLEIKITNGKLSEKTKLDDLIRATAIGLGFTEVLNPMLVAESNLKQILGENIKPILVEFSKSSEHNALRPSVFPGCIFVLATNQNESMPRKIFEIGDTVNIEENKIVQEKKFCLLEERDEISLTEMKSYFESLIRNLDLKTEKTNFLKTNKPYALRCFDIKIDNALIGETFELNPALILDLKIKNPVAVLEINLEKLYSLVLA
ncbi:MAG: phenylalanine--tRNA ligase subunit beta [Nitrososphaeria archaeon]|jgi:phenylalanyl-tRNA synthetase beta chain